MKDIFDSKVLCSKCGKPMKKDAIERNGFKLRTLVCPKCNERIVHPLDKQEYNKFKHLKDKQFRVKMRLVGNSYAVSIPKEIVSFMNSMDSQMDRHKKIMDDMVRLCFEDFGRLSLNFGNIRRIK